MIFWFVSFLYLLTWLSLSFVQVELGIIILKRKIMKSQTEKEKFFGSESSHGELFSKSDNLGRESLSPAAGPCSSYRKETPLREQIRLLKQELAFKEE